MKPKKQFRPANLRALLTTLLVIVTLAGGALFYLGLGVVRDFAVEVNQSSVDAQASGSQVNELQVLKGQLTQSNSLVDKANQLFASPGTYQAQALSDVKNYADAAGLVVASTSFGDPNATGTNSISVAFKKPVSFSKLIAFLNNIEGNLPKMQVSSIALGNEDNGGPDSVSVEEIKIDILVR